VVYLYNDFKFSAVIIKLNKTRINLYDSMGLVNHIITFWIVSSSGPSEPLTCTSYFCLATCVCLCIPWICNTLDWWRIFAGLTYFLWLVFHKTDVFDVYDQFSGGLIRLRLFCLFHFSIVILSLLNLFFIFDHSFCYLSSNRLLILLSELVIKIICF